jgi:uncharacterized membrane-anchored protein
MLAMARRLGIIVAIVLFAHVAWADKKPPAKPPAKPAAGSAAPAPAPTPDPGDGSAAAGSAAAEPADIPPHITGPKLVDLGNDSEIDLPAGAILLERAQAQEIMRKDGDDATHVVAFIIQPPSEFGIVIEYSDTGYVDDGDADKLDAEELFKSYQAGNEQQNEQRKTMGVDPLYLDGWSEMPSYEKATHNLKWGLKAHSTQGAVINYFRRLLGRNGFLSINLVDSVDRIEQSKVAAAPIIAAIRFKNGSRYEDHKSGDKDSGSGLRDLVLGGAGVAVLAKTGLLLKILLVFKKAILFVVVGIGGFFKWLLGKKKKAVDPTAPPSPPTGTDPPPVG